MKMLVFYRSNKVSQSIASSTRVRLERNRNAILSSGLEVEFVNLDKNNYNKMLSNMEVLPKCIYIWHSETEVIGNIRNQYPNIEVIPFSPENAILKDNDGMYPTKEYKLVDLIVEKYRESLEKHDVYVVKNAKIFKESMDDVGIASSRYRTFNDKEDAKQYCVKYIENEINRLKVNISDCKERLKCYEKELKEQTKQLKALEKSMEQDEMEEERV